MLIIHTNSSKTTVQSLFYEHVKLMWQFSLLPMKFKFFSPLPLSAKFSLKKLQQLLRDVTSCQNSSI